MNPIRTGLIPLLLLAAASAQAGPPEGKGKDKDKHHGKDKGSLVHHDGHAGAHFTISIGSSDARRIAQELNLVGYSSLPPGIRKNLARGKPLPPGIAKKQPPAIYLERLPRYPDHEWQVVGTDLVLVAVATAVVVEVLDNVFE